MYPTRLSWGLGHPPNPNWKEWTVLLSDLTFAFIRVKLVTAVITHVLLSCIPLTPISPEKCGPDFIPLLYHQGNHVLSSQPFMYCKFTWSKDATQGPGWRKLLGLPLFGGACIQHHGLGHLPRLMVAPRKLRTFSLGNWAYNFKRILWVTQDTGLCQPACKKRFSFLKEDSSKTQHQDAWCCNSSRLSRIKRDPKAIGWVWRLRQTLVLFYTGFNQAVLKGNFWISLFVQTHRCGTWYMSYPIWEQICLTDLDCGNGWQGNLRPKPCAAGSELKGLDEKEALQLGYHHPQEACLQTDIFVPLGTQMLLLWRLISVKITFLILVFFYSIPQVIF